MHEHDEMTVHSKRQWRHSLREKCLAVKLSLQQTRLYHYSVYEMWHSPV